LIFHEPYTTMNKTCLTFLLSLSVLIAHAQSEELVYWNSQSTPTNTVYVDGYSGKTGCSQPVSSERFKSMMESVNNASFAEDQVRVAKRILKTNCLTIDNLVLILEEISFDEDQLELAKFAYEHVYDLDNYYKVYNVFSFSKSGEELEEYIDNK